MGPRGAQGAAGIIQSFAFGGMYSTLDKILQIPGCTDVLELELPSIFPLYLIGYDGNSSLVIPHHGVYEIEYGVSFVGLDSAANVELVLMRNHKVVENSAISHLIGVRDGYANGSGFNGKFIIELDAGELTSLGLRTSGGNCGGCGEFTVQPTCGLNAWITIKELYYYDALNNGETPDTGMITIDNGSEGADYQTPDVGEIYPDYQQPNTGIDPEYQEPDIGEVYVEYQEPDVGDITVDYEDIQPLDEEPVYDDGYADEAYADVSGETYDDGSYACEA